MEPLIRRMLKQDLERVFAIEVEGSPAPWSKRLFVDCLNVNYPCWVVEIDKDVVAFAIMSIAADEAHILNIAVAKAMRRQGIATVLLKELMQFAKNLTVSAIILEVRSSNQAAQVLYQKFGFKQIGIRKAYYKTADLSKEDALVFKLMLPVVS